MKTIIIFSILISVSVFSQNRDINYDIKAKPEMNIVISGDSINNSMTMDKPHYKISNAWQTNFNMKNYPKSFMECSVTFGSWKVNDGYLTLVNDTSVCVSIVSKSYEYKDLSIYTHEKLQHFFRNIDDLSGVKINRMSKSTGGIYGALGGLVVGELIGLALKKDETDSVTTGLGGIIGGLLGYFIGSQLTPGEKYYDFNNLSREKKLKKLRAILKENYIDA
jgi:hypothetical protein